jgi:hypothetical protein
VACSPDTSTHEANAATTVPARELSYPPSASSSSWNGRLTRERGIEER